MSDTTWVLASGNAGKIREFRQRLEPAGITLLPQTDFFDGDVEETGSTFIENALLKARAVAELCQHPVLADDSGLRVSALGGDPGVRSARYAGEPSDDTANNHKLLQALEGVEDRRASFCCVLVLMASHTDPLPLTVQAQWHGEIVTTASGMGGFGYDPLFYLPELQCTSAELDAVTKNRLSHRGKAIDRLLQQIGHTAD